MEALSIRHRELYLLLLMKFRLLFCLHHCPLLMTNLQKYSLFFLSCLHFPLGLLYFPFHTHFHLLELLLRYFHYRHRLLRISLSIRHKELYLLLLMEFRLLFYFHHCPILMTNLQKYSLFFLSCLHFPLGLLYFPFHTHFHLLELLLRYFHYRHRLLRISLSIRHKR